MNMQIENIKIENEINRIIEEIKKMGDSAIVDFLKKFDNVKISPNEFEIKPNEVKKNLNLIDPEVKKIIKKVKKNIEEFHKNELKHIKSWFYTRNGVRLGQIFRPIEKVGIYLPGGRYNYFSTILMTAIPAKIAGVKEIILTTPPKNISPTVIFTSKISYINKIYKIGGPTAIAALAIGTKTIPKVDMIVGPGNIYVTTAKKLVYGEVGIDMLAGPSEIAIFVDKFIDLKILLADLTAQLEHDPLSKAILVTTLKNIKEGMKKIIPQKYKKQIIIYYQKTIEKAVNLINKIAPEHLEIISKDKNRVIKKLKNVGAIFIGENSPVTLGDYWAGPSHVIPTAGSARFSSSLSVRTFLKFINVIEYDKKNLYKNRKYITKLADLEGFHNHAKSILIRF